MEKHRTRVGLHARNDVRFPEHDYHLVRRARIETLKMMSFTDVSVFQRLRRENPGIEFIVRLYDDRLRHNSRPSPADFVRRMVPVINRLKPYATKFEIHNEPNHARGIEGWGPSDRQARSFRAWYLQVLPALKRACPWASFGFPGLASNSPHRDLEWLDICRDAIRASDWLGCHCYWQYGNMLSDRWGLRFKLYHWRFPNKTIEITEFGDSTPGRPREQIAAQYTRYYQELNRYPYLGSASAFIASSPDPRWVPYVWIKEGGEILPVVQAVGAMKRIAVSAKDWAKDEPGGPGRTFPQTGRTVRGSFLRFFEQYGRDICGLPITDQIKEAGKPTQYFQRLALEEKKPGQVRLKLVGTEAWRSRQKIARLKAHVEEIRSLSAGGAGLARPEIEDIIVDLPTHMTRRYPTRKLTEIDQIIIHHTASSPTVTPRRLAEYQVRRKGKPGITYHFVVTADGLIYQTNCLTTVSEHAPGHNQGSIGICFPGNFGKASPPAAQIEAGGKLCAWLLSSLRLPTRSIVGMSELIHTQSPGKQWLEGERWKDKLLAQVEAALQARDQELASQVAALREQIAALEQENERLSEQLPGRETTRGGQPALAASLESQIEALEQERDSALADLAAVERALRAKESEQAALIASLQAEVESWQQKAAQPQARPTMRGFSPPATGRVTRPPIQDLTDTLPKHAEKRYETRPLSDIKTLVIHHSAVPASVGPRRIARYHVKSLDWPGVGYHFLVAEDGVIYQGNTLETVSNHAAKVNPRGVGICFLGSFQKEPPPPAQISGGAHLVAWLLQELNLDLDTVKGHREFMQTRCPGDQWLCGQKWKQMLRQEIVKVQAEAASKAKPLYHYMLFWHHGDSWAAEDWASAQEYIATFRPTVGFSAEDAAQAQHVTIVGGVLGVPQKVEDWLIAQGCQVERIAGEDEAATRQLLAALVQEGKRFKRQDQGEHD